MPRGSTPTRRTRVRPDSIAALRRADPAKALVMTCIDRLVADGHAVLHKLESGDGELRFNSGETFLLAEAGIVRLA